MEDREIEQREVVEQPQEIVDILTGNYLFHWTPIRNLPTILSKGLYSPAFAKRIGDKDYPALDVNYKHVYVTPYLKQVWHTWESVVKTAGVIIDRNKVKLTSGGVVVPRIAPRRFIGLVLPDEPQPSWSKSERRALRGLPISRGVQQLRDISEDRESKAGPLPIYGTSGDLYWPKRMTHEQIVEILREKQA